MLSMKNDLPICLSIVTNTAQHHKQDIQHLVYTYEKKPVLVAGGDRDAPLRTFGCDERNSALLWCERCCCYLKKKCNLLSWELMCFVASKQCKLDIALLTSQNSILMF